MIIVIDTNVWLKELGLKSALGSAVRFFLNKQNAVLAIPEVIRLEAESNFKRQLNSLNGNIESSHRQLLAIFGSLKEVVLPSEQEISDITSTLFTNLGVNTIDVPFTFESAQVSFLKTIEKLPPSDKTQQFKDGVIWADCIKLIETDDVYLITADKAFYENKEYKKGLSKSLEEDITGKPYNIILYPELTDLLSELKEDVHIDENKIFDEYKIKNIKSLNSILDNNGFSISEISLAQQQIYATENPDLLFFEYEFELQCNDETEKERTDAKLVIKGDGSYSLSDCMIHELRNFGETLSFNVPGEEERQVSNQVIMVGSATIGHRTVHHSIRHQIN